MREKRKLLSNVLADVNTTYPNQAVLDELLYTASETSVIDFPISVDDAMLFYKIVKLARMYGDDLPDELRM